ncbi:MAG: hypothetical protein RLZZ408_1093 [Verrucomicrobiota bacterium]
MPSACFSAPLPRGLVEGASAGQHVAAGAAWVVFPQANPSGRASQERASQHPQRSRPSEQRHNDERLEPHRSLRTTPPGGGAEKPSKGGIPKGRHCFAEAKCRSSSPEDEGLGRGRAKIYKCLQPLGLRRSKPKATKPSASWRGTGANYVGFAVTARSGDAPAKPPYPRPMACPAIASHPLQLSATASMRFNQRFPRKAVR